MSDDLTRNTKSQRNQQQHNQEHNQEQRNQEPRTIQTTTSGTHPAGNLLTPADDVDQLAPSIEATGLIWIEQEDQAKQAMARKSDMKGARAAPDHPHIGHVEGSGEVQ